MMFAGEALRGRPGGCYPGGQRQAGAARV